MTNSIEEIGDSDCIFIIGSNTTENHPVIGTYVKRAKQKGAKLIVADPRVIELANKAEVYMQMLPGTNVALLNGMMHVIIDENLQDNDFIRDRCENYHQLVDIVKDYTPERVEEITGVSADSIRKAARLYATSEKASILYAMGITQHSTGTDNVYSIANLAMLCGKLGKDGCGVNPLRGQNNVQGACDLGALPNVFTGYQPVTSAPVVEKFEKAWGVKLSDKPGLTVSEMMKSAHEGGIKALYIMGENPMVSDPDTKHVKESLEHLELLVVQDIFLTETAELADVVLPASSFAEKDGTFSNTERRVQRIRKAIPNVGNSKADWEIIVDLMNKMGYESHYNSVSEIFEEIASLTPSYAGITYERIEETGIQWPCPTQDHPGTKVLHKESFSRGKGLFKPVAFQPAVELPDDEYPIILTTGRNLYHYHTMTMTGKTEGLMNIAGENYIEINPINARKLDIESGDFVKVISRRGAVEVKALVTEIVDENVVFMPFHYAIGSVNMLTNSNALDNITKEPELKVSTVRLEKSEIKKPKRVENAS
ncbi:formate dehydrogenase H [Oxobacter pfennigii]|uniref:Formate dehydrogenase H n=3 Tax=Oxobacter pfennigii TaxID=36849 RepID=A0A0P8WNG1_9CLOT|nr:formate dehydrogenase H [Oxobacter pfennigii]